jgi:hypothetical protein
MTATAELSALRATCGTVCERSARSPAGLASTCCLAKVFRFSHKPLLLLHEAALAMNLGSLHRGIVLLSEVMLDE